MFLVGCVSLTVRQEDLEAWVGEPVVSLKLHSWFSTKPVVKTTAADGTEIWNYVNTGDSGGGNCSLGGAVFVTPVAFDVYLQFMRCMETVPACNNVFFIREEIVQKYSPIGTGGMECRTAKFLQPEFRGETESRETTDHKTT
jgi:hypothetical protein